jgi:hypothetical protein
MLLGLRTQYEAFIVEGIEDEEPEQQFTPGEIEQKELALWMIAERRGSVFIEMDLLLQYANFEIIFKANREKDQLPTVQYLQITEPLNYGQAMTIARVLLDNTNPDLIADKLNSININGSAFALKTIDTAPYQNMQYKRIPGTGYSFAVRINFKIPFAPDLSFENDTLFFSRALFIFPDFVPQFVTPAFQSRLKLLLHETLPVQMTFDCLFIPDSLLKTLISLFADWHNALVYDDNHELIDGESVYPAWGLAKLLNDIYIPNK